VKKVLDLPDDLPWLRVILLNTLDQSSEPLGHFKLEAPPGPWQAAETGLMAFT